MVKEIIMLIGELAKKSGFSKDTIRYYEKEGVIDSADSERLGNNYKDYSDESLNKLTTVHNLKALGFTITEIKQLLVTKADDSIECSDNRPTIEKKILLIDEHIKQLQAIKQGLKNSISHCSGACTKECGLNIAIGARLLKRLR